MKITNRHPIDLVSSSYSREFDVERSTGCHLMTIVEVLEKSKVRPLDMTTLENLRTPGFLWEHVMTRTDRIEHAFAVEWVRMEMTHHPEFMFPGELFWCRQCDEVLPSGRVPQREDHAAVRHHTGVYFTVDYYNTVRRRCGECKYTWMSSRKLTDDDIQVEKYKLQNMFYVEGLRRYDLDCIGGEFKMMFSVGDYADRRQEPFPDPWGFDIDYTDRELKDNWDRIISNGIALELL